MRTTQPAAARYVKALTHASKFFDLGPEDEDEVRKVKVGLYSNVALCYFKMGNVRGFGFLLFLVLCVLPFVRLAQNRSERSQESGLYAVQVHTS